MPKGVPLTDEEQIRRRRDIFDAAVHLFIEKGFLETSMREIAEAAGVGKSTLYDYYTTKDEILLSFFEEELRVMTERAAAISQLDLPAVEKLRQILHAHLDYLLTNKYMYLKLTIEVQRLGLTSQQRIQLGRHAYQDTICKLIEAGTAEGTFRPVDPLLAMRVLLAALTPVVFTTRPTGSPQEMLDITFDILLNGIKASPGMDNQNNPTQ